MEQQKLLGQQKQQLQGPTEDQTRIQNDERKPSPQQNANESHPANHRDKLAPLAVESK